MGRTGRWCLGIWGACLLAASAYGQFVVSAHSGTVHYVEGQVFLQNEAVNPKAGQYPAMKIGDMLRTEEGRAEVLLTPGVFLRMAENSAVKMVSNQLSDTRLEILRGSILVECAELLKDNAISFRYKDAVVSLRKHGLYRFDTEENRFRVYNGEALVESAGNGVTVKEGKQVTFGGELAVEKFDKSLGDPFYRWGDRRASYLSAANVSVAHSLQAGGYGWSASGWQFNPYYGMFTFIPYSGVYYSPFGYSFWSPGAVLGIWNPYYYGSGWRGYGSGGGRSVGSYTPAAVGSNSAAIRGAHSGGGYSPSGFGGAGRFGGGESVGSRGGGGMSSGAGMSSGGGMSSAGAASAGSAGGSAGRRH
jgi:hypothetical protein